jgi:hypothetical protein
MVFPSICLKKKYKPAKICVRDIFQAEICMITGEIKWETTLVRFSRCLGSGLHSWFYDKRNL